MKGLALSTKTTSNCACTWYRHQSLLTRVTNKGGCRFLSTTTSPSNASSSNSSSNGDNDNNNDAASSAIPRPSQSFAKARFTPGEWDPDHTDPLYRPKFASSAKILSADDFAARPKAGTSVEFKDFTDAMVTLSWLTQRDQQAIYSMYCDIVLHAAEQGNGVTSHEYAMRAVAQRFKITAQRVAGVVQLQHNEQQMRRQGIKLADDVADYMDNAILNEIRQAYQTFGQRPPDGFVEDPVGVTGAGQPSKAWQAVDDVVSVEQLWPETKAREDHQAQAYLDNYVYKVDQQGTAVSVPLDDDCQSLLKRAHKQQANTNNNNKASSSSSSSSSRWKFVAQTVNTRALKKKHASTTSYTNDAPRNTLVADTDGTLRAANRDEVQGMAWKRSRNHDVTEFIYQPVQRAWLDRWHNNNMEAWGKAPPPPKPASEEEEQKENNEASKEEQDKEEEEEEEMKTAAEADGADEGNDNDDGSDEDASPDADEVSTSSSDDEEEQSSSDDDDDDKDKKDKESETPNDDK